MDEKAERLVTCITSIVFHSYYKIIHSTLDASQLQTFTNIAMMTQCEDASSVDRLTNLEAVATKLAPVIFHLPKEAGMTEFKDQCDRIRKDSLEDVCEQIVCC